MTPMVSVKFQTNVDLVEATIPDACALALTYCRESLALQELGMHADDEHLLVVRTVEDGDFAASRQPVGIAPQVVVAQLLG